MSSSSSSASLCLRLLPTAAVALFVLACGDDATVVENGTEDSSRGRVYAIAAELETPEGDVLYLDTVRDLEQPFDPVATGIEIPGASTFQVLGEWVFVGLSDEPTITRYSLGRDDRLERGVTLSFAGVGATSAFYVAVVNQTKAYLLDLDNYVAHIWDPEAMELTGQEIDFGQAFKEERGALDLAYNRFAQVHSGNHLLIPGGWWGDTAYPGSLVLAFNTETDTVDVLEDKRCGYLSSAVRTDSGDAVFFPFGYALVTTSQSSCALVIRDGEARFAPQVLDLEAALGGRTIHEAYQGPGNSAYLVVPQQSYDDLVAEPDAIDLGNDKDFWKLELDSLNADMVNSVASFNDVRFQFDIGGGQVLANVQWLKTPDDPESDSWAVEPQLYDLADTKEPQVFSIGIDSGSTISRIADIVRMR